MYIKLYHATAPQFVSPCGRDLHRIRSNAKNALREGRLCANFRLASPISNSGELTGKCFDAKHSEAD
jgi:hypothetical protein